MRILKLTILLSIMTAALVGCGGSSDKDSAADGGSSGEGKVTRAADIEESPWHATLEAAGYKTIQYKRFPAQVAGKKAKALTYRAANDKSGGVMYLAAYPGKPEQIVWHWYFKDAQPDSIRPVELNDDGLWDVRIHLRGGKNEEYIQGEDFTFVAAGRDDHIAMNSGGTKDEGWWQCFDGSASTSFQSKSATVEMLTPLGLKDGILTIRLADENKPARCDVKVDGKKVLGVDLNETTDDQLVQLEGVDKNTRSVTVVFKDVRGGGEAQVSEIGVK